MMSKFDVRIEELASMKVAVFRGYSETPEMEAHNLAVAFGKAKGLIKDNYLRTFGFNKPCPWETQGDEYGYEVWVVADASMDIPEFVMSKEFPGAKCAVSSIEQLSDIGDAWKHLYEWVKDSKEYEHAHMDGLEEVLSPLGTPEQDLAFNLYLPVIEK
jgi:DNA gyrase inhibitor GyrI